MKTTRYLFIVGALTVLFAAAAHPQFTEQYAGTLTGLEQSCMAWGDYDNDGLLDLLLAGYNGASGVTKLYQNTGSGFTEVFAGLFPPIFQGSVAWGDYDNDGFLDILMAGGGYTRIYRNTGSGFVNVPVGSLPGLFGASAAWGDYDNDGRLDFVVGGNLGGGSDFSGIFRNTGVGFAYAYPVPALHLGSAAWGDYDNDGRLDLLLTGLGSSPVAIVLRNTGSGFIQSAGFTGVYLSSAEWGDYDNDGKLDILLTGYDGTTRYARIIRNTGAGFASAWSFPGIVDGAAAWGDCDNDGLLDVLIAGSSTGGINSKIFRNTGSGFTEVYAGTLTGVFMSSVAWGDYDNDGRLDLVLMGNTGTIGSRVAKLYHNLTPTVNTAPSAPAGLSASASCDTVRLGWSPGSDPETPSTGLSYNLRLGTAPSTVDKQSPMADVSTGWRRIVQLGSADENTSWKIRDLPNGTYSWSVQSIDHAFAGSPFAAEGSFTIMPELSAADTLAFGVVNPGESRQDSIAVTNTGNDTLVIASVTSDNALYVVNPGSGSIEPSGTMKFSITYTPVGSGASQGLVSFAHNAAGSPDTVVVTGTGASYIITASAGPHGSIDPAGEIIVSFDASQRFLFTAEEGFHVDSVLADDALIPDSTEAYTFDNVVTDHTIRVSFALSPVTITTHVEPRWNIVSLPVDIDPAIKTVLYPDAIGDAYCYETLDYAVEDSLTIGCAYWMKFPAAIDVPLTGLPCESLAVPVNPGWNMIGSLTAAVPVSYIVSSEPGLIMGPFFGYDHGYAICDTLRPGVGYWFKSSDTGVLILSTRPPAGPLAGNTLRMVASDDLPPSPPDGGAAEIPGIPGEYALGQAYPNPFNPAVTIAYQLPADSRVTLKIYNALGQVAAILVDGDQSAGYKSVTWSAPDAASGVYFYRLVAVSIQDPGRAFTNVMKAVLLK